MVLTEALARGLPVVSTTAGAIPDTVPPGAGLLVAPGDATALSVALREVMTRPEQRARLVAGAQAARRQLPSWHDATRAFAAGLAALARNAR
jgi:glycosyltransferase involved in cell wall biosynthesis